MTKLQRSKFKKMKLAMMGFGDLDIGSWNFFEIWDLVFGI